MKCVIYVRVSTDEQAKHGYSIPAQIERLEAFCKSQGWEIVGEPFIDDGYSAKDLERPHFRRMMEQIKAGGIDVLLVYRLDRLTRSVSDLYTILNMLEEYNCMFRSATEIYDTTNAMGRLFITLVAAIAQWERENTSERVKMAIEKKVKLGKWKGGTPPYGYQVANGQLQIVEEEAAIVREIFALAKTIGFYTIAKELTKRNIKPRNADEWHVDSIRGIANNATYAGYLILNDNTKDIKKPAKDQKLYEGVHERIIERESFWELQDTLDKRRTFGGKRETSNYYFSSILKCARCGSSMSGHRAAGKKTYRCSGKKAGKYCTSHIILESNLVKTVFEHFDTLTADVISAGEQVDHSSKYIESLEKELTSIQKLLKKKKTMFENDIIDIDELITESDKLRKQEKELLSELKNIKPSVPSNESLKFIADNISTIWDEANEYERKQLITTLFTRLVIDTKDEYHGSKSAREILIVSVSK